MGAIRIQPNETQFEVPRAIANRFTAAWTRSADKGDPESNIGLDLMQGGPAREAPRKTYKPKPASAHKRPGRQR